MNIERLCAEVSGFLLSGRMRVERTERGDFLVEFRPIESFTKAALDAAADWTSARLDAWALRRADAVREREKRGGAQ